MAIGRKPSVFTGRSVPIIVRLPSELRRAVVLCARRRGTSVSCFTRHALDVELGQLAGDAAERMADEQTPPGERKRLAALLSKLIDRTNGSLDERNPTWSQDTQAHGQADAGASSACDEAI